MTCTKTLFDSRFRKNDEMKSSLSGNVVFRIEDLNVEAEFDNVTILHYVVLALKA